jgi:hypothetical protein
MKRGPLLPDEFGMWLNGIPKEDLRRRMLSSITRRAVDARLSIDAATLAKESEILDERYLALRDEGNMEASAVSFRQARLLSALRLLLTGEEDEAVYEFFHSLDNATAEAAITELKNA